METLYKEFRYIDLTTLNAPGQRKLIDIYKKLLKEFPKRKQSDEASDFENGIKKLSRINDAKNIVINKEIDISRLTDKMYDAIL